MGVRLLMWLIIDLLLYKLILAQIVTGPRVVRAEVVLVVTVSLMRVVQVKPVKRGVQVGLEDVGVVVDTD